MEKFLASCRALGHEFRAFVFETTGAVPKTTRIVVNDLLVVSQVQTRNRVRDFKNELYQKVIAAIHEGNANIIGCALENMDFTYASPGQPAAPSPPRTTSTSSATANQRATSSSSTSATANTTTSTTTASPSSTAAIAMITAGSVATTLQE